MNRRYIRYVLPAVISLVTFAVYLPTLRNGFINWDDTVYVYENPHIRSLNWEFFKWAFFSFHAANWHPLTWISHALDLAVWGPKPMGHHLTNIILHALNTFLVVLLITKLLEIWKVRSTRDTVSAIPHQRKILIVAGVTGLLFGLHPLHVESVAWVAERKDLLCALFFLLSIKAYAAHAGNLSDGGDQKYTTFLYWSYLFFILALLSKPMAVSLPVVLLILDWHPFRRLRTAVSFRAMVIEKLPFIALSLISSIITIMAQRSEGTMALMTVIPFWARLFVAARSLIVYLLKIAVPLNLSPYYPYPLPHEITLLSAQFFVPVIILIGMIVVLTLFAKERQVWLSIGGYYIVTLLPVIGISQVGLQSMADRYMYLPSLGPFLLLGLCAAWGWEKSDGWPVIKRFMVVAAIVAVISLSYLTLKQLTIWKDSTVFWNYVIEKLPRRVSVAFNNRGMALEDKGEFDKAIEDFSTVIAMDPKYGEAYFNRGLAHAKKGQLDRAIEDFTAALNLGPVPGVAWDVYSNRGIALAERGELDRAIEDFNTAIGIKPSFAPAYVNRGMAFQKMGRLDHAIVDYTAAINFDPSPEAACKAYSDRGAVFYEKKQADRAMDDFNRVIALYPGCAEGYNNRGVVFEDTGQLDRAIDDYGKALSLSPGLTSLYLSRGGLYLKKGYTDLAVKDYRKACDMGIKKGCDALHNYKGR